MRADALIREYEAFDNLCVRGNLEGTRATIAIVAKDAAVFRHHHANMERHFRATGTQTLIDKSTRLGQRATRVGLVGMVWTVKGPNAEPAFTSAANLAKAAMTELTGLVRPEMRVKRALSLLMESTRASWGLLYLLDSGTPRLVARSAGAVAPVGLVERLVSLIADIDGEDGSTELIATGAASAADQHAPPEVLVVLRSGDVGLVGVAVLKDGARPHPELITAIATALAGASDTWEA